MSNLLGQILRGTAAIGIACAGFAQAAPCPGIKIADDHEDRGTAQLLELFIDETERRTWFLFEASRQEGANAA